MRDRRPADVQIAKPGSRFLRVVRVQVVRFTLADLAFGKSLTDAEGWYRTTTDWERLVRLEPEAAFKAVVDGRDVGTTAAIVFDKVAWIHSVIVRQELRGRGIGDAMMRACMEYLREARGVPTVKLDSVSGIETFYQRFGFRKEYPSWRFLRDGISSTTKAARMRSSDYRDVFVYDRVRTGLNRQRVLAALLADSPDRAFLVRERGKLRGYGIARKGERRNPIGPCVADPGDLGPAADLLKAALSTAPDGKFRMCVAGGNEAAVELAEELGFTKESYSTRMYAGEPFAESPACVSMISAEKG